MDALESILDVAGRGSTSIQELGFRSSDHKRPALPFSRILL